MFKSLFIHPALMIVCKFLIYSHVLSFLRFYYFWILNRGKWNTSLYDKLLLMETCISLRFFTEFVNHSIFNRNCSLVKYSMNYFLIFFIFVLKLVLNPVVSSLICLLLKLPIFGRMCSTLL